MTELTKYDITIVGGGPAGMFAAFYAGMRNAKTQLLESLEDLGGQVNALYPEKKILDVAGFSHIKGRDLVQRLKEQLADFETDIYTKSPVTDLKPQDGGYLITAGGRQSWTKTVIIATGNGAFTPRKLTVDGADAVEGTHLFYTAADLAHFKGHHVMVAGGGDAAIDQALMLNEVAQHVTLIHRRDQFRALEHSVDVLDASTVTVETPFLIKALSETPDNQISVTLKRVKTENELHDEVVDDLLVSYGFTSDNRVMADWQVKFEEDRRLLAVDRTMATNQPGIYAIGDGVNYEGKQALIATAFGEAPIAVSAIMNRFFPDRRSPLHSTMISQ
ncbi:NAD(P)/FAD-dependent oxidoreductase [Levilactobacillus bambusae]|uniref:Ferredoxin--NADP reductase n=1 Tax=Levilactobacillus bambusae TaxID=2024736 RepID=A0A2V1MZ34_9LACO|nr:NAD(P)/FAD-dependent oxidoreductase [Levilactobacillus bambusae]PWG00072.1 ferredoxin--NADP(+) reductase [Levilactobacillus bambusae]